MNLLLFALLLAPAHGSGVERALELAERGALDAAESVDLKARLAPVDRHQLLGYLALRRRDYPRAAAELERAVQLDPGRRAAWLYLGVARHHLGEPAASLEALRRAERVGQRYPDYFTLRARSERLAETSTAAWSTLERGLARFESDPGMLREQVSLLLEIGAHRPALARAERLYERSPRPERDRQWVVRSLIDAGALEDAAVALEAACSAHPGDIAWVAQLAWVHARLGRPRMAARLLDPARLGADRYAFEAADQWRVAGEPDAALRANRHVEDPTRRRTQRLLILVETGALERARALQATLPPEHLDDQGRYAMAFALVHTGTPQAARPYLDAVEDRSAVPGLAELEAEAAEDR